jgi:hypothetical protein
MGPQEEAELGPTEALLVETYGLRLLAYLCGADEELMLSRLKGTVRLSDAAEAVMGSDLVGLAKHVAGQLASEGNLPKRFALEFLGRPAGDGLHSLGTLLRLRAGGRLDWSVDAGGDPVVSALWSLAIDAFPVLLVPPDPGWRTPLLSLYQHPARRQLQAAVQEDGDLRRLFTADDPGIGRKGFVYSSLGRGGGLQDVMFGETIIGSAWDLLSMTRRNPGLSDLLQQVGDNLSALRVAVRGGQATVPARIVFTGFTTQEGRSIRTPWGVLRPLEDWERTLAPPGLEGGVSGADSAGELTTVSYAGEVTTQLVVSRG